MVLLSAAAVGSSFALTVTADEQERKGMPSSGDPTAAPDGIGKEIPAVSYDSRGKRDPFLGPKTRLEAPHIDGPAGFDVESLELHGIVQTPNGYKALVVGPDQKAYFVTEAERFFNATLVRIDAGSLKFQVQNESPLGREPARDVVVPLHPANGN